MSESIREEAKKAMNKSIQRTHNKKKLKKLLKEHAYVKTGNVFHLDFNAPLSLEAAKKDLDELIKDIECLGFKAYFTSPARDEIVVISQNKPRKSKKKEQKSLSSCQRMLLEGDTVVNKLDFQNYNIQVDMPDNFKVLESKDQKTKVIIEEEKAHTEQGPIPVNRTYPVWSPEDYPSKMTFLEAREFDNISFNKIRAEAKDEDGNPIIWKKVLEFLEEVNPILNIELGIKCEEESEIKAYAFFEYAKMDELMAQFCTMPDAVKNASDAQMLAGIRETGILGSLHLIYLDYALATSRDDPNEFYSMIAKIFGIKKPHAVHDCADGSTYAQIFKRESMRKSMEDLTQNTLAKLMSMKFSSPQALKDALKQVILKG